MTWFSWLRRTKEPDYETVLSSLSASIKAREQHLLSIRLRERRANALFITYGIGAWLVYCVLWWFGVVGNIVFHTDVERFIGVALVFVGPVAILFTRRTLRYWFNRKKEAEEKTLKELKKQQRDKVEELKMKTGYYSTRNLLEKYDEVVKKNAETRGFNPGVPNASYTSPNGTPKKPMNPPPPGTPTRGPLGQPGPNGLPLPPNTSSGPGALQPFPLPPPAPSTPAQRTVFDKLADALLGVAGDEGTPNSKYALICPNCFAHNGLVVKEEFDTIQYRCPRCGTFIPRRKSPSGLDPLRLKGGERVTPRRRVQSMHIQPSQIPQHDVSDEEGENTKKKEFTPKVETESVQPEVDVDPEEDGFEVTEPVVMKEKDRGSVKLRQRKGGKGPAGEDLMDVDS